MVIAAVRQGRLLSQSLSRSLQCVTSNAGSSSQRWASSTSRRQNEALQPASASSSAQSSSLPQAPSVQATDLPNEIPSPFVPSVTLPKTHGYHVATLRLESQGTGAPVENLTFFADFAVRAAHALGIPTSKPIPLPMRKALWTVPRGPFVHKKSQENFERRTHKQFIRCYDADAEVVDRWLHFLRIHSMGGVRMRAEVVRNVALGFGAEMLAASTSDLRQVPGEGADGVAADETTATLRSSQADSDKIQQLADEIVKNELATQAPEHDREAIEGKAEAEKKREGAKTEKA